MLAHRESDEFCGIERVIQRQDSGDGSIVLTIRGGDDFGDVGSDGEAFLCQRFKCFDGVRPPEIVIRADEYRSVLACLAAQPLGHHRRRFDFEVRECCSGVDCRDEPGFGFLNGFRVELPVFRVLLFFRISLIDKLFPHLTYSTCRH